MKKILFGFVLGLMVFSCEKKGPAGSQTPPPSQAETATETKGKIDMEKAKGNIAVINTSMGTIKAELMPSFAPNTVENFKKLANSKFYNGTTFHRVIPGFMIQGGDPLSKGSDRSVHGTGGPGYQIKAEFNAMKHERGVLSMARSNHPDSAGSQFFIMVANATHLDGQYTAFGKVFEGLEVVDKIVSAKRDGRDNPLEKIEMKSVTIE